MSRLRSLHPAWIAAVIALAVALWMTSGLLGGPPADADVQQSSHDASVVGDNDEPLVEVRARMSHAEPVIRAADIAGRTAAVRKVKLRVQIGGQVAAIEAERGDHVDSGKLVVRLDAGNLDAELAQARALLKQRKLQYQAAKEMASQNYQSAVGLATAKSHLQQARATVARIQTQIDYTTIEAPFAGVLETLPVELGDVVAVGDVVGQVIQQDPFIVWGQVSEDVVAYLEPGQSGSATLISGVTRQGRVRFISSVADKATRTYRVELEIDNSDDGRGLIAGASAQLRLPLERVSAHRVETAILTLDADGVFGIKSVTDDGMVRFHKANMVKSNNGAVWLAGLPDSLRIITVGQGFVRAGDTVKYTAATDAHGSVADDGQRSVRPDS